MSVLQWHTRYDLLGLEREAGAFLDLVRGGDNPAGPEIADWIGKLERLATEDVPEVETLDACLHGLQAVVGGAVETMSEATWSAVQLSLFAILRAHQFQPTRLSDHALARFLSETLAAAAARESACIEARELVTMTDEDALVGCARAVDLGLAYPEADLRAARMTGRCCLHLDRARRWLDDNAARLGCELIERLQAALDHLEVHGVSLRALGEILVGRAAVAGRGARTSPPPRGVRGSIALHADRNN